MERGAADLQQVGPRAGFDNRLAPSTNKSPQGWSELLIPSCTNFFQQGRIDNPSSERID
jgi:hypothetical protein